jgi:hypothetical protein
MAMPVLVLTRDDENLYMCVSVWGPSGSVTKIDVGKPGLLAAWLCHSVLALSDRD